MSNIFDGDKVYRESNCRTVKFSSDFKWWKSMQDKTQDVFPQHHQQSCQHSPPVPHGPFVWLDEAMFPVEEPIKDHRGSGPVMSFSGQPSLTAVPSIPLYVS